MSTINTLEYAEVFTGELDKILASEAVTKIFLDEAFKKRFIGAKTVRVPDIEMSALGDYDREKGYLQGGITVKNTVYELQTDRGRTFSIDAMDLDETGVSSLASEVVGEFERTKTVPECDALNISKLASAAMNNTPLYTSDYPLESKVFQALAKIYTETKKAQKNNKEKLIAFISWDVYNALQISPEYQRIVKADTKLENGVHTVVLKYNDCELIPCDDEILYTAVKLNTGKTGESDGYEQAGEAKKVAILMCSEKTGSWVMKHQTVKIFSPSENQDMDAYKINYRIYHDLLIKKSKLGIPHVLINGSAS